jgi:nucleoside-diphosphate-sugar epimerase
MPSCFAQPSILRKPLLSAERNATKKAILVTGSTGYIGKHMIINLLHAVSTSSSRPDPPPARTVLSPRAGAMHANARSQPHNYPHLIFNHHAGSRIVERLLACGHNVHVLCRPRVAPGPGDMLQYLKVSPLQP